MKILATVAIATLLAAVASAASAEIKPATEKSQKAKLNAPAAVTVVRNSQLQQRPTAVPNTPKPNPDQVAPKKDDGCGWQGSNWVCIQNGVIEN